MKKKAQNTRKQYDWEAIRHEYEAGHLSVRNIATKHDIPHHSTIIRRAQKEGWVRDYTAEVIRKTDAALMQLDKDECTTPRTTFAPPNAPPKTTTMSHEGVEAAVATNVKVVREHRKQLAKLRTIAIRLTDKILGFLDGDEKGFLVKAVRYGKETEEEIVEFPFLKKESISDALAKVALASSRFIPLERQAFNIDPRPEGGGKGGGGGGGSIDDEIKAMSKEEILRRLADLRKRRGETS